MADRPYIRFWVSDWLGSRKRRGMTLAQTGAYINLLASAWQEPDCGLPDDDATLARLSEAFSEWHQVGAKVRECFEVREGRLFNKKMLDELAHFNKQSENGAKGGRPRKPKQNPNHNPNETQNLSQTKASQKLRSSEAHSLDAQKPDAQIKPPSSPAVMSVQFEAFWLAYPRKVGKQDAIKTWRKLKLDSKSNEILEAVARCKDSEEWRSEGGKFIPHPQRWLNRGGWDDVMMTPNPTKPTNGAYKSTSCPYCTFGNIAVGAYEVSPKKWVRCSCPAGEFVTDAQLAQQNAASA